MSTAAPGRFWTLDVLRGACAGIVFFTHWIAWATFTPSGAGEQALQASLGGLTGFIRVVLWPTGANHPAVICFFVLSGFCIHRTYARDAVQGLPVRRWRDFYRRRFFRIAPVYGAASVLGLVLVAVQLRSPLANAAIVANTSTTLPGVTVRLLGAAAFYPHDIAAGNGPLNTIATEIVLYLAYPLFYIHAARGRWWQLGAVFVLLEILGLLLLPHADPVWIYGSVLMYGLFWYAGAFIADDHVRHGNRAVGRELLFAWLIFFALNATPHFYGLSLLKQNVWGVVCALGVMHCLHYEHHRPEIPSRLFAAARYLGTISYSVYAVHTPVILLGVWWLSQHRMTDYAAGLVVTLALVAFAGLTMHYGVERVFYRRRLSPRVAALTATTIQPVAE